ncbi:hypothetical protein [Candidatus Lokiarchaeum ossiferum]|uniref:hypothetical protein n=1 Tax=Candidatus Lokiarchaeum ossiferum TaxID=2951803 RepID=UPI00352D54E7
MDFIGHFTIIFITMYDVNSKDKLLEAEAKLISSLSTLVWIIPGLFLVQLILTAMGYNVEAWSGESMATVLINLMWIIVILRIIPTLYKFFKNNQEKQS